MLAQVSFQLEGEKKEKYKYCSLTFHTKEKCTPYGILTGEHLYAMKRFWSYIQDNPQRYLTDDLTAIQVAYVLPKDYGWGFRGSEDKVWGFWLDELSTKRWTDVNYLLHTHHLRLDIIYDNPKYHNKMRT